MNPIVKTLPNGLRFVMIHMDAVESVTVEAFVRAGSRDEDPIKAGLAHYLEHMVFKGTSLYPSPSAVSTAADSVGAEINAGTGKERTGYYLKVSTEHTELAFKIVSQLVFDPLLRLPDIKRELGVIKQEIAMYNDLPTHKVSSIYDELMFGETSLAWDIAGYTDTVEKITREDMVMFLDRFYKPSNMVLAVAGKFQAEREIMELAERWFGGGGVRVLSEVRSIRPPRGTSLRGLNGTPSTSVTRTEERVKLFPKQTEQAHLILGVRGRPLGSPDRYKELVLSAILGGGMSSRLFTEIREKRGLAYYVRSDVDHYTDMGHFSTRAGVKVEKVEEAIQVILKEVGKIRERGEIGEEELKKAKEYVKGKLVLNLEETDSVADFFGEMELLEGKITTLEDIKAGIDKVTIQDVQLLAADLFCQENIRLAVVGPYTKLERFEKLLK